jgi:lysophospholipase L1-like esterase
MILIERRIQNEHEPNINKYNILINDDLKNILSIANDIVKKNNQEFYFVYLPGKENFYPKKYADTYKKVNYLKPKILAMVKDLNINIIDMEQYLKDEIPSEMFPEKGHYNARGYQLIAEKLFESLQ